MNEEIRNNEMELVNNSEVEVLDYSDNYEESGSGILGKVMIGAAIAGVGLGAVLLRKNRDKINDWRIRKLEKAGYTVAKVEDAENYEEHVVSNEDVDDESEE